MSPPWIILAKSAEGPRHRQTRHIIEAHGGYVDKYIGDSIVAIFGAPAEDRDHAANAARAALDCCKRLEELNFEAAAFQGRQLTQRIGIVTSPTGAAIRIHAQDVTNLVKKRAARA